MRLIVFLILWPWALFAHGTQEVRYAEVAGELIFEARGGVDETTPFAIASIGKAMTSVAVLKQVEAGALALDDPISEHLPPEIVQGFDGFVGITVSHLLTMSSGLPEYHTGDYRADALDDPDEVQRAEEAVTYAMGQGVHFAPGTGYEYSNTSYVLLGLMLERVTGLSYAQVIARDVFEPADMRDSVVFGATPLPKGFPRGHSGWRHVRDYYQGDGFGDGGVLVSARDLVAFYRALFLDGRLLSEEMLAQMLTAPPGSRYGMGIVVNGNLVGHEGGDYGFASSVVMNRATGDIAVQFVGREGADVDWPLAAMGLK